MRSSGAAKIVDIEEYRRRKEASRAPAAMPASTMSAVPVVWYPLWVWMPVWP